MNVDKRLALTGGILWTLSFFLSLGFLPSPGLERLAAVLAGMAGLSCLVVAGGALHRRMVTAPLVCVLCVAFGVLLVLSTLWSVAPYHSWLFVGGALLVPFGIVAVLVAQADMRALFLSCVAWGGGILLAGLCLWVLVQAFFLPEMLVAGRVRHPFGNPNAAAGMLNLAFFVVLGLAAGGRAGVRVSRLLWCLLALVLCALVPIAGKAAMGILLAGVVVLAVVAGRGLAGHWRAMLSCLAAMIVVWGVLTLLPGRAEPVAEISKAIDGGAASLLNRFDIWRAAWALVMERPLMGAGYHTFSVLYPAVRLPADFYSGGQMAHADPLQLWVELGVAGPVLFYALGIVVLCGVISFLRRGAPDGRAVETLAVLIGCVGFVAHSHIDFLFYVLPSMMVFSMALALLVVWTQGNRTASPFGFMARCGTVLSRVVLLLPVVAVLGVYVPVMLADHYAPRAGRAMLAGDLARFGEDVNMANRIGFGWNARPYLMAATVPVGLLGASDRFLAPQEQKDLFLQADGLFRRALDRHAALPMAWHSRAQLWLMVPQSILPRTEEQETAEVFFQRALAIDPAYLPSRMGLADLYVARGQADRAYDVLRAGVVWPYPSHDPSAFFARLRMMADARGDAETLNLLSSFQQQHERRSSGARTAYQARQALWGDDPSAP